MYITLSGCGCGCPLDGPFILNKTTPNYANYYLFQIAIEVWITYPPHLVKLYYYFPLTIQSYMIDYKSNKTNFMQPYVNTNKWTQTSKDDKKHYQ